MIDTLQLIIQYSISGFFAVFFSLSAVSLIIASIYEMINGPSEKFKECAPFIPLIIPCFLFITSIALAAMKAVPWW